jgi:hypothetical protein
MARNSKGKDYRLFVHDPPENCSMLEEEKYWCRAKTT